MVHLGGLTPPASQAKSGGNLPRRAERSSPGVSLSVVRVTALVERAIARLERRTSALLFNGAQEAHLESLAKIELRCLSRGRSALSGLAATVENDAVILETLQMAAHDTEAMIAELESNDTVRLRCLTRQAKTLIPELRARGIDCNEWVDKLKEIRSLCGEESIDLSGAARSLADTALQVWTAASPREETLLDSLLGK